MRHLHTMVYVLLSDHFEKFYSKGSRTDKSVTFSDTVHLIMDNYARMQFSDIENMWLGMKLQLHCARLRPVAHQLGYDERLAKGTIHSHRLRKPGQQNFASVYRQDSCNGMMLLLMMYVCMHELYQCMFPTRGPFQVAPLKGINLPQPCVYACMYVSMYVCMYVRHAQKIAKLFFSAVYFQIKYIIQKQPLGLQNTP